MPSMKTPEDRFRRRLARERKTQTGPRFVCYFDIEELEELKACVLHARRHDPDADRSFTLDLHARINSYLTRAKQGGLAANVDGSSGDA